MVRTIFRSLLLSLSTETLTALCKDRRRIASIAGVIFLLSVIAAILVPPTYTAQASLLVLPSPEYTYRPEAGTSAIGGAVLERDAIINSEIDILTSTSLLKLVVQTVGLGRLYPSYLTSNPLTLLRSRLETAEVALGLRGKISPVTDPVDLATLKLSRQIGASTDKFASVINVTFRHRDPQVAADVLTALVDAYTVKRQAIYTDTESSLFSQQAENLRKQLDSATGAYAEFEARNGISNFNAQLDIMLHHKGVLSQDLGQTESSIAEIKNRLSSIREQMISVPSQIVQYSENDNVTRLENMHTKLENLRQKETEYAHHYQNSNRQLEELRAQITDTETEINQVKNEKHPTMVRTGHSEAHAALEVDRVRAEADLSAAQARWTADRHQIDEISENIASLNANKVALEELERQKNLLETSYDSAVKILYQRQMVENIAAEKAPNVRLVQEPEPPIEHSPIRLIIVACGLFASMIAAATTALMSQWLRHGFLSPEELERSLGCPVLASIPWTEEIR